MKNLDFIKVGEDIRSFRNVSIFVPNNLNEEYT